LSPKRSRFFAGNQLDCRGSWVSSAVLTSVHWTPDTTPFGEPEKQSNEAAAEAFRRRLEKVAGFRRLPKPLPDLDLLPTTPQTLVFSPRLERVRRVARPCRKKKDSSSFTPGRPRARPPARSAPPFAPRARA